MSCIKFPSSKNEPSKASNKENINNLTNSQLSAIADQVFGKDNWSHAITNQTLDFIDYITGKYQAGCVSIVRVQLRDGTFHESMGYCNVEGSSKGSAIHKARTSSFRDAFQKALMCFGHEITNKINKLSNRVASPVSSEQVHTSIQQTKPNVLSVIHNDVEALVDTCVSSQTDLMMNLVDLDQVAIKDNKTNTINNLNKLKIEKINLVPSIDAVSKLREVNTIQANNPIEIDLAKQSTSTVSALKKDTKSEETKTTLSTAISDEEMRLERKRKQRELQEEFKRQQEIKKKYSDTVLKPNPRY